MKVRNEIKVGIVILIAIGLLYFGMSYLKGSNIFNRSHYYYSLYENVNGLTRDNVVRLNGVKVGRVAEMKLLSQRGNLILVKMEILESELQLPDSTQAIIENTDLLGTMGITLELGQMQTFHMPGDTLIPGLKNDVIGIVEEKLAPLQIQMESVIDEAKDMIARTKILINTTTESVAKAQTSMDVLNKTTADVDKMVIEQNENLTRVITDITAIASNIRANSKNINNILQNVATISDSLTRVKYAQAIQNASDALEQLDSVITKINSGEGSLGLLLNDDRLYRNLEQASMEIDKLAEDLRLNPKRYVHFSVFGRKEEPNEKPEKKTLNEEN